MMMNLYLEESLQRVYALSKNAIDAGPIRIQFEEEDGLDAGGLAKDWFNQHNDFRPATAYGMTTALDEKLLINKVTATDMADNESDPSLPMNKISSTVIDRFKLISHCITSMSNFSVQYNFQAISVALLIMTEVVCTADDDKCKSGEQASWVSGTSSAVVFMGAIVGQLTMGYAGDVLGRNKALTLTLSIASISAMLSATASRGSATTIYSLICVFRFMLGVGVGGVYPLSATKAAEDSGSSSAAAWAFFWQTPGAMAPWLLGYLLSLNEDMNDDSKWRLVLGLGSIFSAIVVCGSVYEAKYKPTIRYPINTSFATSDSAATSAKTNADLQAAFRDKRNVYKLIATGGGWFVYDVAYYGFLLFGKNILKNLENSDDVVSLSNLRGLELHEFFALSFGIPAVIMTIYLIQKMGTRKVQIAGFVLIAVCFVLLAVLVEPLKEQHTLLYVIYCILIFALSFGPNVTTFILPSETFPKNVRSTFNGVSAASGKLGAACGAYLFSALSGVTSYSVIMVICAILSIAGAVISYYFIKSEPERTGSDFLSVESLLEDDDVFNVIA